MDRAFIEESTATLGAQNASILLDAIEQSTPVVSVRRNPIKLSNEDFKGHFAGNTDENIEWCSEGIYLKERPLFAQDPLFHAGAYYVQEAASMAVSFLFKEILKFLDSEPLRVLDLCAAPGGKTTAISSLLNDCDLLVANEVIRSRATILAENITKWGRTNTVVTNSEAEDFARLSSFFDIVLADVPCSGEGMFRKDANAIEEWSSANVALCASRQKKIISDVWSAIKPGGFLIYSTCTFNHFENDSNVEWIASQLGGEICHFTLDTPLKTKTGLQFVPGITKGEGFFCAVIRKNGDSTHSAVKPLKPKSIPFPFGVKGDYIATTKGDLVKIYPKAQFSEIGFLESNLRVIRSGVAAATIKGKDMIPDEAFALSEIIPAEAFPTVDLSLQDSLKYLRLEPLIFSQYPKGFLLLRYKGINLGFVKNIGNRSNNLFPTNWRLRSL